MPCEVIDLNAYRRKKAGRVSASDWPACYPPPSRRFTNLIFSAPEEPVVLSYGLGTLLSQLDHEAGWRGHTLVILKCEPVAHHEWDIAMRAYKGEQSVNSEFIYDLVVDEWNNAGCVF
jgi:hypothetical protein